MAGLINSIQWKTIAIFLLLILLAMELIGVYLLGSLEDYYLTSFSETLSSRAEIIGQWLGRDMERRDEMQKAVDELGREPGVEVMVLDPDGVVLVSSQQEDPLVNKRFDLQEDLAAALSGSPAETVRIDPATGQRRLNLALPITSEGEVVGAIFLNATLEGIYDTLNEIRTILFSATALALVVTAVMGLVLSRTITGPIREITLGAGEMAGGKFDQELRIRSRDEIGQLASMFNHLARRLKDTLAEISSEKSKVEAIINYMADGLVALDPKGNIMLINPAAANIFQVKPEEVIGRPPGEVLDGFEELPAPDQLGGSQAVTSQIVLEEAQRVLRAHFAPIMDESKHVTGMVIVLQDITEQERLASLRKEFVANVSHELRTPLTTIKSYIETLLDGAREDAELAQKFLTVVDSETNRLVRLVTDLLQLSRLDYERARWKPDYFSMKDLVEEVRIKLAAPTEKKNHRLYIEAPDDLPPVYGDRDKIQQVLINLLGNAVEYTPPGGQILLSLSTSNGGESVAVTIKDNGIGIPAEDLPRVFERFYRVDKGRSRDLGGTGLGLSIAKEIVESHGGTIDIRSRLEEGTEVCFTLPVTERGRG